ncbi:MAG: LLM class flavin-dependent oxidoreductase [Patulibacter sp.]|nr:LLM class flavin-dependent oxidoreductase [Patulibacter sp.]
MFGNYTDWDRFIALEQGDPAGQAPMAIPDSQVMAEHFVLTDLVEPLGFDTLWSLEQHAAPYLMLPDPTQFLTYYAGRTTKIDMGSMITVLPWHNPFRLAEQISMLQHFMGPGRKYYLGVGRGLARRNFDAMGVSMDESRERFNEVCDVLKLAFTEEIFSYDGEFYTYENVSLRPRPLDSSVITEAWGSWTSEQSIRNMGERGFNPLTTPNKTTESYLKDLDQLNEIRAEAGYGEAERPILQLPLYCRESAQQAEEEVHRFIEEHVDSILRMYELGTSRFGNAKGYEQYTQKGSDFGSGTKEDAHSVLVKKFLADGLWGTPAQVAEKVEAHHKTLDPSEIMVLATFGSMPAPDAEVSLRLFADEVVPKLAHLRSAPVAG